MQRQDEPPSADPDGDHDIGSDESAVSAPPLTHWDADPPAEVVHAMLKPLMCATQALCFDHHIRNTGSCADTGTAAQRRS